MNTTPATITSYQRLWLPMFERVYGPDWMRGSGRPCLYCNGTITTEHSLKHPGMPTGTRPSCSE